MCPRNGRSGHEQCRDGRRFADSPRRPEKGLPHFPAVAVRVETEPVERQNLSGACKKGGLIYCDFPRAVIGHTTSTRSLRVP